MAKYDVFRLPSSNELALECQSDLLSHLDTRFISESNSYIGDEP